VLNSGNPGTLTTALPDEEGVNTLPAMNPAEQAPDSRIKAIKTPPAANKTLDFMDISC
jgi:hypothetical protein